MATLVSDKYVYYYAVPSSGWGHVEDEQPFPFISCLETAEECTPRFGGDRDVDGTDPGSVSMPHAVWRGRPPISIIFTRLLRRRVNIYWRNFLDFSGTMSGSSLYLQDMRFESTQTGFRGGNSCVSFERIMTLGGGVLKVEDQHFFKKDVEFQRFVPQQIALFGRKIAPNTVKSDKFLFIFSNDIIELGSQFSSTGRCSRYGELISNVKYRKGSSLYRSVKCVEM